MLFWIIVLLIIALLVFVFSGRLAGRLVGPAVGALIVGGGVMMFDPSMGIMICKIALFLILLAVAYSFFCRFHDDD